MNITSAKYVANKDKIVGINVIIDGQEWGVPLAAGNRHYDEIMRQAEAGILVIQDATPTETTEQGA